MRYSPSTKVVSWKPLRRIVGVLPTGQHPLPRTLRHPPLESCVTHPTPTTNPRSKTSPRKLLPEAFSRSAFGRSTSRRVSWLPLAASLVLSLLLPLALPLWAQDDETSRARNQPVEPLHLIDNVYYVGASDIASYLITTPQGHIVIDGGFVETAPMIRDNIESLGFDLADVKWLLNSHAHFDHAAGLAALAEWSGAKVVASRADAPVLAAGGSGDYFISAEHNAFPAVEVARTMDDGEQIRLGGTTLTANLTPGHTRGCTSWSMQVDDGGTPRSVVFVCSVSLLPGVSLLDNEAYPSILEDYLATYQRLEEIPCDVFLAAHASFFDLAGKRQQVASATQNPFVDPEGYRAYLAKNKRHFDKKLAEQRAAAEKTTAPEER